MSKLKAINPDEIKSLLEKTKVSLVDCRAELKKIGYENTYFSTEPICMLTIVDDRKTFVLLNKNYADDPDFVAGELAGGFM